jgi:hypothetical protein
MNRFLRPTLFALMVCVVTVRAASAANYYIAANGSDTNNGTSKTTPWLHAPGMKSCANLCASANPQPGDQFIFRGGDTWHFGNSSATPYVGSTGWNWSWSGSNGNPIYLGVDQTWYTGSSWVRPVLTGDNPLNTSFVTSCAYDQSNLSFVNLSKVSYVTLDNFDFPGKCWSSASTYQASVNTYESSNLIISNNYFHGWTAVLGSQDNHYGILGNSNGPAGKVTYNQIVGNVFDGSDSSQGAANSAACASAYVPSSPCQSGEGVYSEGYDIHDNVFRYLSNMIVVVNAETVHDNLFEYLYNTYTPNGPHSNVINEVGNITGGNTYFYNNIVRHTHVTEDLYITVGATAYFFNNVLWDNMNYFADIAPTNCIIFGAVSSSGSQTAYIYNNTVDGPNCNATFSSTNSPNMAWNGTAYFQNNHLIGFTNLAGFYHIDSGAAATIKDNGNELFQTESVANAQGYVTGNNYAPAAGGATIGAGASASSQCVAFSTDSELCGGTSDGASEQSGSGGQIAVTPAIPMNPRQTAWDIGAYQFSGVTPPSPPTGLSAIVE